jgi:hypothetical protein
LDHTAKWDISIDTCWQFTVETALALIDILTGGILDKASKRSRCHGQAVLVVLMESLKFIALGFKIQGGDYHVTCVAIRIHEVIFECTAGGKTDLFEGTYDFWLFGDDLSDQDANILLAGDIHQFADHFHSKTTVAKILGEKKAHLRDVPLGAFKIMQGGRTDNPFFDKREQRKNLVVVQVIAPLLDQGWVFDMMSEVSHVFVADKAVEFQQLILVLANHGPKENADAVPESNNIPVCLDFFDKHENSFL